MLYLKACGKCNGDVAELSDIYGPYLDCLQCGRQPISIAIKENQKNVPVSIDRNVQLLWSVSSQRPMPHGDALSGSLEKRLKDLENHQYITMEKNSEDSSSGAYKITPDGKSVIKGYLDFIRKVETKVKSVKGSGFVISYELVDEDGKLTMMGEYAVKQSKVLSKFVEDIYPMAVISLEDPEKEPPE